MEAERDVPPSEGGHQVPSDVLAAVPLVLAAGPAVGPVHLDHPLAVFDDLVHQLAQHGQASTRQPGPPPHGAPDQLWPPAPQPVEDEAVEDVTKTVRVEKML